VECAVTGATGTNPFTVGRTVFGCESYSNSSNGFFSNANGTTNVFSLAYDNGQGGYRVEGSFNPTLINCTAYGNTSDGFSLNSTGAVCYNSIAEGNGGWGFLCSQASVLLMHCAGYLNTSGNVSLGSGVFNASHAFVTGSASFFTNAAAFDFSLNDTAGGGADARAAGIPGVYPDGLTTSYTDIGGAMVAAGGAAGGVNMARVFTGM
jgi:parallel beta-helix repeat protein